MIVGLGLYSYFYLFLAFVMFAGWGGRVFFSFFPFFLFLWVHLWYLLGESCCKSTALVLSSLLIEEFLFAIAWFFEVSIVGLFYLCFSGLRIIDITCSCLGWGWGVLI